jgi:hypothetical protein
MNDLIFKQVVLFLDNDEIKKHLKKIVHPVTEMLLIDFFPYICITLILIVFQLIISVIMLILTIQNYYKK